MASKKAYQEKMEAQLKKWGAKIDSLSCISIQEKVRTVEWSHMGKPIVREEGGKGSKMGKQKEAKRNVTF
jgi:hypothetical protein